MVKITKNMAIGEILDKCPKATELMFKIGLHCVGCPVAMQETLEQGAKAHGLTNKQIEGLIKKINKLK